MAKRWVRDDFAGDGSLVGRATQTGQTWGTAAGGVCRPTGIITEDGSATFVTAAGETSGYGADVRAVLIDPPTLETTENIYEWTIKRFPDVSWSIAYFYKPAEILLCFESPGGIGGEKVQAIRVLFDTRNDRMAVTEPTRSRADYGTMYDGNPGYPNPVFHYPLPDLDDPSHPDEYAIKLRTNETGCTLWLNGDLIFEDVPRVSTADWGAESKRLTGVGFLLGRTGMPGSTTEPYMGGAYDFRGVMEVTEFRFNYTPVNLETGVPLNQMARKDGLNASGEYQMNQQGVGRPGGPIWQLSGQ